MVHAGGVAGVSGQTRRPGDGAGGVLVDFHLDLLEAEVGLGADIGALLYAGVEGVGTGAQIHPEGHGILGIGVGAAGSGAVQVVEVEANLGVGLRGSALDDHIVLDARGVDVEVIVGFGDGHAPDAGGLEGQVVAEPTAVHGGVAVGVVVAVRVPVVVVVDAVVAVTLDGAKEHGAAFTVVAVGVAVAVVVDAVLAGSGGVLAAVDGGVAVRVQAVGVAIAIIVDAVGAVCFDADVEALALGVGAVGVAVAVVVDAV